MTTSETTFTLDDDFLVTVGLGALPPAVRTEFLSDVYATLERRVGMRLALGMNEAELDRFEEAIATGDEAEGLRALEEIVPDYRATVADELRRITAEIERDAPAFLAATRDR